MVKFSTLIASAMTMYGVMASQHLKTNKSNQSSKVLIQNKQQPLGYIGCFVDNAARDVNVYQGDGYTVEACQEKCSVQGYTVASVQYYGQCFCDNDYGALGQVDESECNYACNADKSQTCGGFWRNSVYEANPVTEETEQADDNAPYDAAIGGTVQINSSWSNLNNKHYPVQEGVKKTAWPGTCAHSKGELASYWSVDFEEANIYQIDITNRSDCCSDRLQEWEVLVDGRVVYTQSAAAGAGEVISIPYVGRGSQILVQWTKNRSNWQPYLTLCGVQVWSTPQPTAEPTPITTPFDAAIGGDVNIISSWSNLNNHFFPVLPGRKDPNWQGTCAHSQGEKDSWWSVDFEEAWIESIDITNRQDCCAARLQEFEVLVDGVVVFTQVEAVAAGAVVNAPVNSYGSQVLIQYTANRSAWEPYLTLCGVQVWAYESDPSQSGDCAILYSECNYEGESVSICDEHPDFTLKAKSIYVPEGSTLHLWNDPNFEGETVDFTESQDCIADGLSFSFIQLSN